jgi:glycosyltransferase involved in cell wall biosynthesis
LLEAMACGRAIVSTPAGCRGLDLTNGVEIVIAEIGGEPGESDSAFSGALVRVLENEGLRMVLAREARRAAERRFGWDAIAKDALESYAELTGVPIEPQAAVR